MLSVAACWRRAVVCNKVSFKLVQLQLKLFLLAFERGKFNPKPWESTTSTTRGARQHVSTQGAPNDNRDRKQIQNAAGHRENTVPRYRQIIRVR